MAHRAIAIVLSAALVAGLLLTTVPPPAERTTDVVGPVSEDRTIPAFAPDARHLVEVAPAFLPNATTADLGPLASTSPMELVVGLASRDPSGLAALSTVVSIPGSPAYRQFVGGAEAAARFGPSPGAVGVAEQYFAGFGLNVTAHPDGLLLSVAGPAQEVGRAFGTTFEQYRTSAGTTFFGHPTPALLPSIVPWTGVYGLGSEHPMVPDAAPVASAAYRPLASCGASTAFTPCDIQQAYSFAPILSGGTNGSGIRIGVVDAYAGTEPQTTLASDLAQFSTAWGLPAPNVTYLYPVPTSTNLNSSGTNPNWADEDAIDLQWAHASAPAASLVEGFSPNPGSGMYFAVDALVASRAVDVLSLSWGEPDVGSFDPVTNPCSAACNASTDGSYGILGPILELAAVEGITVFAATGDCGAADGTAGVSTNFPASEPWVTGVGGTVLTLSGSGGYGSETGWSGNASGGSGVGCAYNQGGSGGGFSPFPKPVWQHGPGTRGTTRGVPDVAMNAAGRDYTFFLNGGYSLAGGTSIGTPIWAGIAALGVQSAGRDLGLLNPVLYGLLNSSHYASTFHDIRTGNNGYNAGVGWDPVTGIGTPIVSSLVPYLNSTSTRPGTVQTFVYASPRFGPSPLTTTAVLTARGGSGTYPLEGVLFGDGNASLAVNGSAQHTYNRSGAYSVQSFVVDANGSTAASPAVLVVVGGGGPLTVTLAASTQTPAVGAPVTFNASVAGGTPPYLLNLTFGDGALAENLSGLSTVHRFEAAGGYCAEAAVRDAAKPQDAGASARLAIAVGGAAAPACGNPAAPLTVTGALGVGPRDAPADFPALFTVSGGSVPPAGLQSNVSLLSDDPYTDACGCTIFRAPGNYTVGEWVNDTVNGEGNATVRVTVAPPLNATFSASTLAGPVPLIVNFSASVVGGVGASASATHWDFGSGPVQVGARAGITFSTPGEHVVIASLADHGHGNASEAFLIDAEGAPPPVALAGTIGPVVNVSSGTNVTYAVRLIGSASTVANASVEWTLGNGDYAFGPLVTETYLTGQDALSSDTLAAGVTVFGPHLTTLLRFPITLRSFFAIEPGGFEPATSALAFDANVAPAEGVIPFEVWGNATVVSPLAANTSWTFGDPGTAAGLNVTHFYYGSADYNVVTTAYDGFHDQEVRNNAVVANEALAVMGGPDSLSGDAPFTVQFNVSAYGGAGPPYSYNWTYPAGTAPGVTLLTLTFEQPGRYTVSLVVSDRANATDRVAWTVTVTAVPSIAVWEVLGAGAAAGTLFAVAIWWRRSFDRDLG